MSNNNSNAVAERSPYLPTVAGVLEALILGADYAGRKSAQGAVRAAPALCWWPIRGAFRILGNFWRLCLPQHDNPPTSKYQAQARVTRSFAGFAGFVLTLTVGLPLAWFLALWLLDPLILLVGLVAGMVGLVFAGRPHVEAAIEAPQVPDKLVNDLIELLVHKLPGAGLTADKFRMSAIEPVFAENAGQIGKKLTIGLPAVAVAADVAKLRPYIAGVFSCPTDRVKITEGTNPNQAIVYVADLSPSELPAAAWPLADAHSFDLTRPIPIGQTPDGKPATLQLFSRDNRGALQGHHVLLAGMTGYGKSTLLQLILSAAALDPRAVLNLAVLKDTDDFEDIAPALSYLAVDASLEELKVMLSRAVAHMATRAGVPYVVVIDEAQNALGEKGDPEAREMVRLLLSSGRSAGIAVILVTQEPTAPNLVPDLARRPQNRISFWQSQNETAERAMGSGMTDDTNPSKFGADDLGLAAVIGTNGLRGRVKTPMLAPELVARIARAHPREQEEPVFPTYALDHDDQVQDPEPETIIDHLHAAWLPGWDRGIHCADLVAMLTERFPRQYAGLDVAGMNAELRRNGLEPRKGVKVNGKSATGIYWADLQAVKGGVGKQGKLASP